MRFKNLSRYDFNADGSITNNITGKAVEPLEDRPNAYRLTTDTGKPAIYTKDLVIELVADMLPKPPAPNSDNARLFIEDGVHIPKPDTQFKKTYVYDYKTPVEINKRLKLNYDIAMQVRQRIAGGETRKAIARELEVDKFTIQLIAINYSYRVKEEHVNPIPDGLLRKLLKGKLPRDWEKLTPAQVWEKANRRATN